MNKRIIAMLLALICAFSLFAAVPAYADEPETPPVSEEPNEPADPTGNTQPTQAEEPTQPTEPVESEPPEETDPPALTSDRIPTNYIAAVPAQITKMDVRGGKAMKAVGDLVKPGDLLISGTEEDKFGACRYYHADGIVTGIYPDSFTQMQPFVAELPVRGETVTNTVLSVFGQRIPLTLGFVPPRRTDSIIYEEDREPLMLLGRALPLTLLRCRYTRQASAITVFSEDEARAALE